MPEAPDVQIYCDYFNQHARNKKIRHVDVENTKVLKQISIKRLQQWLKGKKFQKATRHGKYLIVPVSDKNHLVLHFGMTGFLRYYPEQEEPPSHARVVFQFSNQHSLAYVNQRLLGKVFKIDAWENWQQQNNLGTDLRDITQADFLRMIGQKQGSIKSALMDQAMITGIGNIYSDEILFQAGIHPKTKCQDLTPPQLKKLYSKSQTVFEAAVKSNAQPQEMPKRFMLPHRDTDQKCPKSHGSLDHAKISGRTSYFCPKCQKL
jgi:formamidopyrimidine-DNA glycosylase